MFLAQDHPGPNLPGAEINEEDYSPIAAETTLSRREVTVNKPASTAVKVRPLKKLRDMVS